MLSPAYLSRTLRALILVMWAPMPAWAASIVLDPVMEIERISLSLLALAFGLSTLSGATALVWRLDKELRAAPDGKLPRPLLFAASNMLGSWTAGSVAWLLSQSQQAGVYATLVAVILLSFGGARAIELLAEKYINRGAP